VNSIPLFTEQSWCIWSNRAWLSTTHEAAFGKYRVWLWRTRWSHR